MKCFRKIIAILLSLVAMLSLCACGGQAAISGSTETTGSTKPAKDPNTPLCDGKTLKILAITSSFGLNTTQLLYDIAKAEGATEIIVGRLYISGCSLEMHVGNAKSNANAYRYTKISSTDGVWKTMENVSLAQGLNDEAWDIIFTQQGASQSGQLGTYSNYVEQLMAYIKETKKTPTVGYVWNVLWAYQQDTDQAVFHNVFNSDQMFMYQENLRAAKEKVLPTGLFDALIPSGTAVQNARTSYFGDTLTKDTYHLNNLGRVIAGYTLWSILTGKELTEINVGPVSSYDLPIAVELTDEDRKVVIECVNNAIKSPWEVTPSSYPAK
ncbi:MAG: DUF4886 domain-containing protein [Oscillospiraceae bacterium]|nr:DUF4886 domain-containing protein [Oscillospiraceae bacterium]